MKQRILNVLIAVDQLLYVLVTLGVGCPDETMSSAAWRTEQKGRLLGRIFRPVLDWLFSPLEPDHCHQSYLSEVQRKQAPQEAR